MGILHSGAVRREREGEEGKGGVADRGGGKEWGEMVNTHTRTQAASGHRVSAGRPYLARRWHSDGARPVVVHVGQLVG